MVDIMEKYKQLLSPTLHYSLLQHSYTSHVEIPQIVTNMPITNSLDLPDPLPHLHRDQHTDAHDTQQRINGPRNIMARG